MNHNLSMVRFPSDSLIKLASNSRLILQGGVHKKLSGIEKDPCCQVRRLTGREFVEVIGFLIITERKGVTDLSVTPFMY